MVLIDTSVWIRFLSGRLEQIGEMRSLISNELVAGHELVFWELLIGDKGGRAKALEAYGSIHQSPTVSHEEVVAFVRKRKLHGRGASWIDVHLLASAMVAGVRFWTIDPRLQHLASELGIGFEPFR